MARTLKDAPITSPTARKRLKVSQNAYFRRLTQNIHIGYRRTERGAGLWTVRTVTQDGKYKQTRIPGVADDLEKPNDADVLSFDQACARARDIVAPAPSAITVERALDKWAEDKRKMGLSDKAERDLASYVKRTVAAFPNTKLVDVTRQDVERFRDAFLDGYEGDRLRARRATANRALASLKGVLNYAADRHLPDAARPWALVKKFSKSDSFGKRVIVFTDDEETELYEACETPAFRNLVRAHFLTGCRFGEIQSARVKDLAHRRLTVNGKTGERTMVLSTTADTFFTELAQGCDDPDRWLLLDHDGEQWDGDAANWRFKQACKIAGLPPEASLYTARHSYITRHLVKAVPVMAIAQQCGTSLSMIEATYANFISDQREAWFDG